MNTAQYSRLKPGDKVKVISPITNNSQTQTLLPGTILPIGDKTPRVSRNRHEGLPWFFWSCHTGLDQWDRIGLTKPNTIEKVKEPRKLK